MRCILCIFASVLLLLSSAARAETLGNSTCNAGAGTLSQDIYAAYLADTSRNGFSVSMTPTQQAMICSQVWAFVQFMASLPTPLTPPVTISGGSSNETVPQLSITAPAGAADHAVISINTDTPTTKETGIFFKKSNVAAWEIYNPANSNDFRLWSGVDRFYFGLGTGFSIGSNPPGGNTLLGVSKGDIALTGAGCASNTFAAAAALHIACQDTSSGRLTQMSTVGVSIDAINLIGSTDGAGNTQWWTYGVGANNQFEFNNSTNLASPSLTMNTNGAIWMFGYAAVALPASPNGTIVYCSNCTIANPCAAGGTGALAKRLNGAWVCN